MNYFHLLLEALQSIKSNLLRVFLTCAIISIGISSLVGILTSIDGIKSSISDSFSDLGSNIYTIESERNNRGRSSGIRKKNQPPIKYRETKEFKKKYEGVGLATVSTVVTRTAELKYKSETTNPNVSVESGDENYISVKNIILEKGRNFTKLENESGVFVVLIGSEVKSALFKNNEDPINKYITARGSKFRVIGLLEKKGSSFGGSGDNRLIIPIETARKLRPSSNYVISIKVDDVENLSDDIDYSTYLFKILRKDPLGSELSFTIEKNESLDSELDEISGYLKTGGFAIGIITLLGASIGLMNIMLVSVTERTREIGLRKSVGATPKVIKYQFLIESILICQLGGLGGVILGLIFGNLVTIYIGGGSFIIPWLWMIVGILISTFVGILSGYIPARKASKLDPIEALRFE